VIVRSLGNIKIGDIRINVTMINRRGIPPIE
jgi:hypothetical protein